MELNTISQLPEWLSEDDVKKMQALVSECPNPYTQEEIENMALDKGMDYLRAMTKIAKDILTEYGISY